MQVQHAPFPTAVPLQAPLPSLPIQLVYLNLSMPITQSLTCVSPAAEPCCCCGAWQHSCGTRCLTGNLCNYLLAYLPAQHLRSPALPCP